MESMNTELKVGDSALIIGCALPENSPIIGKVVTVEEFVSKGDNIIQYYDVKDEYLRVVNEAFGDMVVCSGVTAINKSGSSCGRAIIKDNYIRLQRRFLMPLPKLPEEEIVKDEELVV